MFHTADPDDVKAGRITDVYFERTMEVLKAKGVDRRVRAEFIAKSLPDGSMAAAPPLADVGYWSGKHGVSSGEAPADGICGG